MTQIPISSLEDLRLAPYRDLNQRNLIRQSGLFIAEGQKVVDRLIESPFPIESLLAEPTYADRYEQKVPPDVPIYVVPRDLLQATIGFNFHRGILACGRRQPRTTIAPLLAPRKETRSVSEELPAKTRSVSEGLLAKTRSVSEELPAKNTQAPSASEEEIAQTGPSRQTDPPSPQSPIRNPQSTILICPDIQDPTNLGSLIRTAAALGCDAVLLGPHSADPFSRRVLRVSMGAALHLPIIESRDLSSDLQTLQSAGYELIAAVVDHNAEPLHEARRPDRLALLLGNEAHGLADEWLSLTHRLVTIPMHQSIDSLNLTIAAAILLYHFTSGPK